MATTSLWAPWKVRLQRWHGGADADADLEALLERMRWRLYPETMPVLGSYWLKTVYGKGHKQEWWRGLGESIKHAIREEPLQECAREVLVQLHEWAHHMSDKGVPPEATRMESQPFRATITPERLVGYVRRLLNQSVPAEVAYLLADGVAFGKEADDGMPAPAIAKAIERMLVRDRLSPATLEMFLQPDLLSPQYIYPADAEIVRDVVLALLGETRAPSPPVMPAIVLTLAPGAPLPRDYAEAVRHAMLIEGARNQEVHVPITAVQALEMLKCDSMRIASTIVTMDGRWWESQNLESGEQNAVEYRPGGRLRIDFSAEHARLAVPLPDTQVRWGGPVHLQDRYEIFGREWRVASWESDSRRSWAHLVFSGVLPMADVPAQDGHSFPHSHPASVDMAWSAMADALASALAGKSREPLEQLRRTELIPLGRAIYGFAESVERGRLRHRETIETQLRSIRYQEAEVSLVYGRAPWAILPAAVQKALLKVRLDAGLLELLGQAFDGIPSALTEAIRKGADSHRRLRPASPRQAA